jgi:hypothetical protein
LKGGRATPWPVCGELVGSGGGRPAHAVVATFDVLLPPNTIRGELGRGTGCDGRVEVRCLEDFEAQPSFGH